jgi:hypothetical protein
MLSFLVCELVWASSGEGQNERERRVTQESSFSTSTNGMRIIPELHGAAFAINAASETGAIRV